MNNTEKTIRNASEIRLEEKEKAFMKANISEHIKQNSILSPYIKTNPFLIFINIPKIAGRYLVLTIILLMLTLGVGTSVMAQNALPGSILYPIKIHINENLESFVAVTPKAVAKIGIKQAARRLAEAEILSDKGELTASSTDEIKNNFKSEISMVGKKISELESKGATSSVEEIKDEFEKKIKSRDDIYVQISGSKNKKLDEVLEMIKSKEERREKNTNSNDNKSNEEEKETDNTEGKNKRD